MELLWMLLGLALGTTVLLALLRLFSIDASLRAIRRRLEAGLPTTPGDPAARDADNYAAGSVAVVVVAAMIGGGMALHFYSKVGADTGEAAAVASLRSLHVALTICEDRRLGFPSSLADGCMAMHTSSADRQAEHGGYRFTYSRVGRSYAINADPTGQDGERPYFFVDETGVVRRSILIPAGSYSEPLK